MWSVRSRSAAIALLITKNCDRYHESMSYMLFVCFFLIALPQHDNSAMQNFLSQATASIIHFWTPCSRHLTVINLCWYSLAHPYFPRHESCARKPMIKRGGTPVHVLPTSCDLSESCLSASCCSS